MVSLYCLKGETRGWCEDVKNGGSSAPDEQCGAIGLLFRPIKLFVKQELQVH